MNNDDRWIPADPAVRAGVYQSIHAVPDHQRLRVYANEFDGRDCWAEYLDAKGWDGDGISQRQMEDLRRSGERWKSFMEEQGRHHALCTPAVAEAFARCLLEDYEVSAPTAADYWADLERFYRWMFHHAEYPHRYHPFVMAAVNHDRSRELWNHKVKER